MMYFRALLRIKCHSRMRRLSTEKILCVMWLHLLNERKRSCSFVYIRWAVQPYYVQRCKMMFCYRAANNEAAIFCCKFYVYIFIENICMHRCGKQCVPGEQICEYIALRCDRDVCFVSLSVALFSDVKCS